MGCVSISTRHATTINDNTLTANCLPAIDDNGKQSNKALYSLVISMLSCYRVSLARGGQTKEIEWIAKQYYPRFSVRCLCTLQFSQLPW